MGYVHSDAMRAKSGRASTFTLEIPTAIAGAAVVRSWRTDAVCAASGEPLKRWVRYPCTTSPNARLSPRNGACARSEERRVGKGVDLGGRRIIKKKKENSYR